MRVAARRASAKLIVEVESHANAYAGAPRFGSAGHGLGGSGRGLAGLEERVRLVGGEFSAGRAGGDGLRAPRRAAA